MVEQEIARGVAHHLVQRRPRWLRIERIVEQLLDPGGEQVLGCAIPGIAQGPGAPRRGARAARFVRAHLDLARDRAASCARLPGRERRMPGARRWRLDLGEPEIRRAAMALPRGGGHAAIRSGQRELSFKRLFGRLMLPPPGHPEPISPAASQTDAEPCGCAFPAAIARRNAPVISDNAVVAAPMNWRAESTGNSLPLSRSATQLAENHGKSRSARRHPSVATSQSAGARVRPLYPRKRTKSRHLGMSALCQKRSLA